MILNPVTLADSTRINSFGRTVRTVHPRGHVENGGPRNVPTVKAPDVSRHCGPLDPETSARMDRYESDPETFAI